MSFSTSPPPGWYADPWRIAALRWWDGHEWTAWAWAEAPRQQQPDPASPTFSPWAAVLVGLATVATIFAARGIGSVFDYRRAGLATFAFYGLLFSGMSPDGVLPEIVERPDHPWFVGVQFHPELKSKPFEPHPLFAAFIAAAVKQSRLV